jgi:hypothetical protein
MRSNPEQARPTIDQAVKMFEDEFKRLYPDSRVLVDGEGFEDEDIDLIIYVDGDPMAPEFAAVEISHAVEAATGFFILPFVLPQDAQAGR